VVLTALAVWALFWAIKSGQYDDLEDRILMDDERTPEAHPKPRENP
jgi:cbb3-type cytochrome oxidase maturation protein